MDRGLRLAGCVTHAGCMALEEGRGIQRQFPQPRRVSGFWLGPNSTLAFSPLMLYGTMNFVDLFCGAGGWTTGLKQAGLRHVVGVEHDPSFAATYAANHRHVLCRDVAAVTKADLESFLKGRQLHLLAASPPCTSFSTQGMRKAGDARDLLYRQAIRIAKELSVPYVVLENVTGVLSKRAGGTKSFAAKILQDFARAGYDMQVHLVSAADHGVPQRRRRAIFLGARRPLAVPQLPPPLRGYDASVGRFLLPDARVPERYFLTAHLAKQFADRTKRARARGSGWTLQVVDPRQPAFTLTSHYWANSGYYGLVRVTSHKGYRMMTPSECAAIMGFPARYKWGTADESKVYKMLGNAVCPPLAKRIGQAVVASA